MSLFKQCLFALAALLAGSAAVGTLNVQIREYEVPTPKSRPHDPAVAPDGSLWYTGQGANKLGRLDPKTGEFKEYPLKTPSSGPHGLVAGKDGNIWFTAISAGYVGKLDPKTGEIAEYRPDDGTRIENSVSSKRHLHGGDSQGPAGNSSTSPYLYSPPLAHSSEIHRSVTVL